MDSRVEEKEGSLISTENDSQVTDPASSWVADSPVPGGPPTKVMRLGSPLRGQDEEQTGGEETQSEGEEVAPQKDLLKEALADVQLVQGRRSKAIPYTRRKKDVTITAVRKSGRTRGADVGTPALEKAQRLTAEKNLEKNLDKAKGKAKGNPFSVLDVISDPMLSTVAEDSCLLFHPKAGSPAEALSLIRAKEEAQAALAATSRRLELEEEARRRAEPREAPSSAVAQEAGTSASPNRQGLQAPGEGPGSGEPTGEGGSAERAQAEAATPSRGRPRRKCAKTGRPLLNVRKGQNKRKGTK
jgi:hypothetical protein